MRGQDGRAVPTFIRQALSGQPLTVTGDGRQTRSLCYVDDTVRGLLTLAASDHPGPVNLGNPVELSVRRIAKEVRRVVLTAGPVRHTEAAADDPRRRCPDITVASTALGWRPRVELTDGLRRTVAWVAGRSGPAQSAS
jgi:dTDP-glucose 4,6-dehydratase